MKLGELQRDKQQAYLVYGRSKAGKTFGAGTFPRPNFLDFDSGILTLAGADFIAQHGYRPDILYEQFREKEVMKSGVVSRPDAFDAACRWFDASMKHPDTFDTWVIDTGTSLAEAAMNKAVWLLGGQIKGVKSETLGQAMAHGLLIPKLQDYGAERSMVEQFVGMVLTSGKHVVLLCHEKETVNDAGVTTGIMPLLTGKGVETICAMFNEVYRLTAVKRGPAMVRTLTTRDNGIVKAGSRDGMPDGTEWSWDALQTARNGLNVAGEK